MARIDLSKAAHVERALNRAEGVSIAVLGHKLVTDWRGVQSTYAHGRCECGSWSSRGWTERMRSVRIEHQNHLDDEVKRAARAVGVEYAERA